MWRAKIFCLNKKFFLNPARHRAEHDFFVLQKNHLKARSARIQPSAVRYTRGAAHAAGAVAAPPA